MADMHILKIEGDRLHIVMHLPVAAANNDVGISYRDCLVNSGMGGTTTLADGDGTGGTIAAAEKTQIQAGEVYELSRSWSVRTNTSPGQLRTDVRKLYGRAKAEMQAKIPAIFRYYGYTESEV
jgi:hypothetical protein